MKRILILILCIHSIFWTNAQNLYIDTLAYPNPNKYLKSNPKNQQNYLLLDSIVGYRHSDSCHNYKTIYTYNNQGYIDTYIEYQFDVLGQNIILQYNTQYTYDSNGNLTLLYQEVWDKNRRQWIPRKQELSQFSSTNKPLEFTSIFWSHQQQTWIPYSYYLFQYDLHDNLILYTESLWQDNSWHNNTQISYLYNDNNHAIQSAIFEWDADRQAWTGVKKTQTLQNDLLQIVATTTFYFDIVTQNWIPNNKEETIYTDWGDKKHIDNYLYNVETWQHESQTYFEYDDQNMLTNITNIKYNIATDRWTNHWQTIHYHTITDNTKSETQILYTWNNNTLQWLEVSKQTHEYNLQGNLTLNEYYVWDTEIQNWFGSTRGTAHYDSQGNQTNWINYRWDTTQSTWNIETNYIFFYTPSTTSATITYKPNIIVYPNPITNQQLFVEGLNNESPYYIYNSLGKCVLKGKINNHTNSIAFNKLAAGFYLIKIITSTQIYTYNLFKQ